MGSTLNMLEVNKYYFAILALNYLECRHNQIILQNDLLCPSKDIGKFDIDI